MMNRPGEASEDSTTTDKLKVMAGKAAETTKKEITTAVQHPHFLKGAAVTAASTFLVSTVAYGLSSTTDFSSLLLISTLGFIGGYITTKLPESVVNAMDQAGTVVVNATVSSAQYVATQAKTFLANSQHVAAVKQKATESYEAVRQKTVEGINAVSTKASAYSAQASAYTSSMRSRLFGRTATGLATASQPGPQTEFEMANPNRYRKKSK